MYNLFSISQLCDKDFDISFQSLYCIVTSSIDNSINVENTRAQLEKLLEKY